MMVVVTVSVGAAAAQPLRDREETVVPVHIIVTVVHLHRTQVVVVVAGVGQILKPPALVVLVAVEMGPGEQVGVEPRSLVELIPVVVVAEFGGVTPHILRVGRVSSSFAIPPHKQV
jgi:hypothetical protein